MIDFKSKLVLKILAQQGSDGNYRIVEIPDVITALPKHYRMDSDAVKHIFTYLERQDLISIKYDDDDKYCLAVLPYGFEVLEKEHKISKIIRKDKQKNLNIMWCFLSSLFGTILGIVICYFILKLF